MRIAVCISGEHKSWKETYKGIKKFFNLNGVDVDYFINVYDLKNNNIDVLNKNDMNEIKKYFNPVDFVYDIYDSDEHFNISPEFRSLIKSIMYKRTYEIREDFFYDIVVKVNFNVKFNPNDIFYIHDVNPLYLYNSEITSDPIMYNSKNIDFSFFYGDSNTINYISSIYWWYKKMLRINLSNKSDNHKWLINDIYYNINTIFYKYLHLNNIEMKYNNIIYDIIK